MQGQEAHVNTGRRGPIPTHFEMALFPLQVCSTAGKMPSLSSLSEPLLISLLHIKASCKTSHHSLSAHTNTTGSSPPAELITHVFVL